MCVSAQWGAGTGTPMRSLTSALGCLRTSCPFAVRLEGTKNKPWGFQAHMVPGAGSYSLGRSAATEGGRVPPHGIPAAPSTRPGLLLHKGFLLSHWPGSAGSDMLVQTPQMAGVVFLFLGRNESHSGGCTSTHHLIPALHKRDRMYSPGKVSCWASWDT